MARQSPSTPLAKAFRRCAVPELKAASLDAAFEEIVDAMVAKKIITPEEKGDILGGLIKREKLGTTAIGKGVALPHVRRPDISEVVGAIGHSTPGIDCRALDGNLTHTICVLLTPVNPPEIHLDFMTKMVALASDDFFTKVLNQTKTRQDFVELFEEKELEIAEEKGG